MKNEVLALYIGFMDKVLSNARIDYLRKMKRIQDHEVLPGILPDVIMPDNTMVQGNSLGELIESESLKAALQMLNQKEIIVLYRLVCLEEGVEDVARRLGIHEKSVIRIKQRTLQKLRMSLTGGAEHD